MLLLPITVFPISSFLFHKTKTLKQTDIMDAWTFCVSCWNWCTRCWFEFRWKKAILNEALSCAICSYIEKIELKGKSWKIFVSLVYIETHCRLYLLLWKISQCMKLGKELKENEWKYLSYVEAVCVGSHKCIESKFHEHELEHEW